LRTHRGDAHSMRRTEAGFDSESGRILNDSGSAYLCRRAPRFRSNFHRFSNVAPTWPATLALTIEGGSHGMKFCAIAAVLSASTGPPHAAWLGNRRSGRRAAVAAKAGRKTGTDTSLRHLVLRKEPPRCLTPTPSPSPRQARESRLQEVGRTVARRLPRDV
jgi:hypothetical protein